MTPDQKINLFSAFGAWFSGIATFCAVLLALYLARKVEKIKLKVSAEILMLLAGDGTPGKRIFDVSVTNIGERNVTVSGVSYVMGNILGYIPFGFYPISSKLPTQIAYSERANFIQLADEAWEKELLDNFFKDVTLEELKALKIRIDTSVGQVIEIKPGSTFLNFVSEKKLNIKLVETKPTKS